MVFAVGYNYAAFVYVRFVLARALVVSSYFPPLGSVGSSIRLIKFLKYLSDWDWRFVVFTQDVERTVVPQQMLSGFLLDELPANTVIRRVAAPFSSSKLASREDGFRGLLRRSIRGILGDSSLLWGVRAFWRGFVEMRKSRFDLVFGVTPPFTNALVMMLLGLVNRTPFVLDLKDDWVGSPAFLHKGVLQRRFETVLESLIVRSASAIITASLPSYHLYTERYKRFIRPEKFHFIPNGCDLDEYEGIRNREREVVSPRFLILSAAWGYRKNYRDLRPFLLALDVFFKRRPDARHKVDVIFLGDSLSNDYDELLTELDLDKVIQRAGTVERSELLEWLWKADLFLLVQPVDNVTAVSGTLYEYWATGKAPILLISEEGASSALAEDNRIGRHFHFDQIEKIADYIEKTFHAYQIGKPIWIERAGIQSFDRKVLAKRMNDLWKKTALAE